MPSVAPVVKFAALKSARPVKAALRPDTAAGVQDLIALAPLLGHCNPQSVPVVTRVMLNLIGVPPAGGEEVAARAAARLARREIRAAKRWATHTKHIVAAARLATARYRRAGH